MTDYAAQGARGSMAANPITKRTGTTSSDRVAVGSRVLYVNAGAGTHVITLTNTNTYRGLAVANQTISIPTASAAEVTIDPGLDADGDGYVAQGIDGTANEITFYVMGA